MRSVAIGFSKPQKQIILVLAIMLGLGGCAYLTKGIRTAWNGGDFDFRSREREWKDFEQGAFPNPRFTPEGRPVAKSYSVYPAYALPMFAPFFGPGDFRWARLSLQITSLICLGLMMVLGWNTLCTFGWQAGLLGGSLGLALSGNCSTLALGQFSLISSGLIAAQILALRSNRCCLAGVCWAFAMIKPQIAVPFALLFLLPKKWLGLLCGGAILAGLSAFALAWTGWSLSDYVVHSLRSESLSFIKNSGTFLGDWLSIPPRLATLLGIGVVITCGVIVVTFFRTTTDNFVLPLAGFAGMLGWVLFYHRQYDNQMLFPLMLAVVGSACRNRTVVGMSLVAVLAFTLYLPAGIVAANPAIGLLAFLVPVIAAGVIIAPRRPFVIDDGLDLYADDRGDTGHT